MTDVVWHPAAVEEHKAIPDVADRASIQTAVEKLKALGERLPFPHQSAVKGATVRELRPRSGRSRWRAFYGRIANTFRHHFDRAGGEGQSQGVRSGRHGS